MNFIFNQSIFTSFFEKKKNNVLLKLKGYSIKHFFLENFCFCIKSKVFSKKKDISKKLWHFKKGFTFQKVQFYSKINFLQ